MQADYAAPQLEHPLPCALTVRASERAGVRASERARARARTARGPRADHADRADRDPPGPSREGPGKRHRPSRASPPDSGLGPGQARNAGPAADPACPCGEAEPGRSARPGPSGIPGETSERAPSPRAPHEEISSRAKMVKFNRVYLQVEKGVCPSRHRGPRVAKSQ